VKYTVSCDAGEPYHSLLCKVVKIFMETREKKGEESNLMSRIHHMLFRHSWIVMLLWPLVIIIFPLNIFAFTLSLA